MNNKIKLTGRLNRIAGFINNGAGVIDVGTDHGYIPVYLAQEGGYGKIIASDLRPGPLAQARLTAEKAGVADRIEFVLADGLSGIDGEDIDTVIVAGMGGETIISILSAAPWTKNSGVRLILQPQTKQDELVEWLLLNGYSVMDARLVKEEGRLYTVLLISASTKSASDCQAELYVEKLLLERRDTLLPEYLNRLIDKLTKASLGMKKSPAAAYSEELEELMKTLNSLIAMREETEK